MHAAMPQLIFSDAAVACGNAAIDVAMMPKWFFNNGSAMSNQSRAGSPHENRSHDNRSSERKYKRILLKLSGEALGKDGVGIDPKILDRMALEIGQLIGIGVQVGLVVGGGNIFRGAALQAAGLDRVTGDHMGMLATVMNALAMRDALERSNIASRVMSAIPMSGVVDHYDRRKADARARARRSGDFRGRHRQSVFHHRFGGLPARHRNQRRDSC